ncbi:hypothetical protein J6590_050106 [Homalodisca vitripennis]|nr:hypothetical protein J6590_050106 [Homalodisca vitripennis]
MTYTLLYVAEQSDTQYRCDNIPRHVVAKKNVKPGTRGTRDYSVLHDRWTVDTLHCQTYFTQLGSSARMLCTDLHGVGHAQ